MVDEYVQEAIYIESKLVINLNRELILAAEYLVRDPEGTLNKLRKVVERLVESIYEKNNLKPKGTLYKSIEHLETEEINKNEPFERY